MASKHSFLTTTKWEIHYFDSVQSCILIQGDNKWQFQLQNEHFSHRKVALTYMIIFSCSRHYFLPFEGNCGEIHRDLNRVAGARLYQADIIHSVARFLSLWEEYLFIVPVCPPSRPGSLRARRRRGWRRRSRRRSWRGRESGGRPGRLGATWAAPRLAPTRRMGSLGVKFDEIHSLIS